MKDAEQLSDNIDENFDVFLADAVNTGCVWALQSSEGFALCPSVSNDDIDVMPLWSQPEFASLHSADEWQGYEVVPIAVEELLDEWLPGMHGDTILVGINWNAALEGAEIEPLDLVEEIDKAASA